MTLNSIRKIVLLEAHCRFELICRDENSVIINSGGNFDSETAKDEDSVIINSGGDFDGETAKDEEGFKDQHLIDKEAWIILVKQILIGMHCLDWTMNFLHQSTTNSNTIIHVKTAQNL